MQFIHDSLLHKEDCMQFKFAGQQKKYLRGRKNLGLINILLESAMNGKIDGYKLLPGDAINTQDIYNIIITSDLEHKWNRDPNAKDDNGLIKSLSDLLGGHGLNLTKLGVKKYLMPKQLPIIEGDMVVADAVY